ncbi:MAG: TlpA family protein disulfide reductase [Opitutia bacterium]|jgi:thiol-disulfide isomerase/thioredoxin
MRLLTLLAACVLASPTLSAADKPAKEPTLADFKLGRPVLGKGSLADAKGKGVVIEAWGVRCPPCIASLPKLQELSVRHRDKVLFFGAESQDSDRKAIEAVIAKAGVTFPISTGLAKCPIEFNAIPRAFVFDATGKLIFDGTPHGKGFAEAVEKAAAGAKGP